MAHGTGTGPALSVPLDIAVEASGDLVVTDGVLDAVLRVDPVTGDRVLVSGPKPAPVGGLTVDLDGDLGDLPLETAQSSGSNTGVLAGTIAGVTAVAIMLTGAAWYARRRWVK